MNTTEENTLLTVQLASSASTAPTTPISDYSLNPSPRRNDKFHLKSAKLRAWAAYIKSEKDILKRNAKIQRRLMLITSEEDRECLEAILEDKIVSKNKAFIQFFKNDPKADKFFVLCILYVSQLIKGEVCTINKELKETEEAIEKKRKNELKTKNLLKQLSFVYSQILQSYPFINNLVMEKQFYETLYFITVKMVVSRFDTPNIHPFCESVIQQLFRSKHFYMSPEDRKKLKLFLSTEQLHRLKEQTNVRYPLLDVKSKISKSDTQSPLLECTFPKGSKNKSVPLYIPEKVSLSPESVLRTRKRKKNSQYSQSTIQDLEEEVARNEFGSDLPHLQLRVLYEADAIDKLLTSSTFL